MRISLVSLVLALGCGSKAPPPESPPPPDTPGDPPANPEPVDSDPVARACEKIIAVHGATPCGFLETAGFTGDMCAAGLDAARVPDELQPAFAANLECLGKIDSCDAIKGCFGAYSKAVASVSGPHRECGSVGLGSIALSPGEAAKRHGQGVTGLSAAPTTRDRPIEVCGVEAQHQWLIAARCDDGSQPITDRELAAKARSGSVGPGGRCKSTIDRYIVSCPEKTYDVFMDLYMCGPGESI